ncbi:MAG TPA: FAD-binding oxidoreductase, partial [Candidatus Methylomirabilis sp.]|nr:FAD-binding oxidoreductase [Candidatus Methylomirabilis sp.]
MAVSSPAVAEALAEIVGGDRLVSEGAVLSRHAVDALSPRWVVWPGSAEEVSRVLALATAERLAVTPRGSGSSLPAGNPPRRLDLVLDLTRLDAIVEHVPADMVATVEAGVRLEALARRLAASGQRLTLDPIGGAGRTVGGVLATNASGPLRARHGTARDILLGVRFVQADGTITWGGSKVVKSVTGYDVPKLMVGSLGTLGIVVGATLRLQPLPPASASWLVEFREAESVEAFLAAVVASSLEPERCAVLNERARQACRLTGAGPAVAVSIASVEEAVVSQGMLLKHLADAHGGDSRSIEGAAWGTLDLALAAPVVLKLACEPRRICFWSSEIERLAGRAGWQIS